MLKKAVRKNGLYMGAFCIFVIFISFVIYNITHEILTQAGMEQRLAETMGRLLASAVIVAVYKKLFDWSSFGFKRDGFLRGMVTGGFLFCVIILNAVISILEVLEYPVIMPSVYVIFIVIVEQLFVGIFEEFLFRGFILNMFLSERENGKSMGKITAILISSVLFGLIHLLNLFENPQLVNYTVSQVFYATFIGIYLGALYLRTENIWIVVIYHAAVNLAGELPAIFYESSGGVDIDISLGSALQNILFNSVFMIVGLIIARKLKEPSK